MRGYNGAASSFFAQCQWPRIGLQIVFFFIAQQKIFTCPQVLPECRTYPSSLGRQSLAILIVVYIVIPILKLIAVLFVVLLVIPLGVHFEAHVKALLFAPVDVLVVILVSILVGILIVVLIVVVDDVEKYKRFHQTKITPTKI